MWIETQERTAQQLARAREQFAAAGRASSFGLRTHLIARDTESEAWRAADDLLSKAEDKVRAQREQVYAGTPMVGQRAQAQAAVEHRIGPNLWNGISTVRVNCGTAIVGSYDQVANELLGYWRLGIDEFILSGYPHVEECRRVASELLPLVRSLIREEGR
jgi:alkanesulfonate monooxygenase